MDDKTRELIPYGYAPGDYMIRCLDCGAQSAGCDKRAGRCRSCAEKRRDAAKTSKCSLCGEPMPPGEEMFKYHGYSGPCPKPPLPKQETKSLAAAPIPHHCAPEDVSALVDRLEELNDPQRSTQATIDGMDLRTFFGVCARVIRHMAAPTPPDQAGEADDDIELLIELEAAHNAALVYGLPASGDVIAESCTAVLGRPRDELLSDMEKAAQTMELYELKREAATIRKAIARLQPKE